MSFFVDRSQCSREHVVWNSANMLEKLDILLQDFTEVQIVWMLISSEEREQIRRHNTNTRYLSHHPELVPWQKLR